MSRDLGLLFLRVTSGLLMLGHGWGKVSNLVAGKTAFADPLGIGAVPSLILTAFAEFVCSLLVIAGLKTRLSAVPVVITMLVAAFVHHASDPLGDREPALLFAIAFSTVVFTGGGRFALDSLLGNRGRRRARARQ